MNKTITHSERNKGWTSFWSYIPDWMLRLNNNFFTIKSGQLWIHNDLDNPTMNNFYNSNHNSKIKTVINEAMAEDKIFKTLILESNQKWNVSLKTNLTEGKIKSTEFNTRESRQFSFIRGNENSGNLQGNSAQGIGVITDINDEIISFSSLPILTNIGDKLYQLNGSNQQEIGVIQEIDREQNTITVQEIVTNPTIGLFSFSIKNSRVEGEEMRGYYLEVELENQSTEPGEIFAVSTNTAKSYV